MILTEIGEIGVYAGEDLVILRPSLHAISSLGAPEEIVSLYARVMAPAWGDGVRLQRQDARYVVFCCAPDSDLPKLQELFGHDSAEGEAAGIAPPEHALAIARCLLKHGVVGAIKIEGADAQRDYSREFIARDHVALAMAHLGLTEREAWQMTVTGLVAALKAKFPAQKGEGKAPTPEEHDETMAWFDRIASKRAKRTLH